MEWVNLRTHQVRIVVELLNTVKFGNVQFEFCKSMGVLLVMFVNRNGIIIFEFGIGD